MGLIVAWNITVDKLIIYYRKPDYMLYRWPSIADLARRKARGTRVGIMQIVHFGASGKAAASTSRPVDALRALARVTPADHGVAGETEFGMRHGSSVAEGSL